MTKTFAQVIYSDLTADEADAVKKFLGDNGLNWEDSPSDPSWVRVLNASAADLSALEINVFGSAVAS
jgi:hypothetical protein